MNQSTPTVCDFDQMPSWRGSCYEESEAERASTTIVPGLCVIGCNTINGSARCLAGQLTVRMRSLRVIHALPPLHACESATLQQTQGTAAVAASAAKGNTFKLFGYSRAEVFEVCLGDAREAACLCPLIPRPSLCLPLSVSRARSLSLFFSLSLSLSLSHTHTNTHTPLTYARTHACTLTYSYVSPTHPCVSHTVPQQCPERRG